jgi:hypothetical protein
MNVRVSRIVKVDLKQRTTYRFSLILKRLVDCLAEMHQSKFGITINGWKVMSVVGRSRRLRKNPAIIKVPACDGEGLTAYDFLKDRRRQ